MNCQIDAFGPKTSSLLSMNKTPQTDLVNELAKPHPERLFLLGGVWLAMMCFGVFGTTALIDPNAKLPIIDPILRLVTEKPETAAAKLDKSLVTAVGGRISQIVTPVTKPEETEIAIETVLEPQGAADAVHDNLRAIAPPTIPEESASTKLAPVPTSTEDTAVPFWVYVIIIASCASGSLLMTYLLYKATQPKPRQPQTAVRAQTSKTTIHQRPRAMGAQPVMAKKASNPRQIPIIAMPKPKPVPAIAPLHISTPTKIAPPQLHLEPVTDPEPAPQKISRAEQLAAIANQAKHQPKKSLVDLVDIRRQGPLAQFP